LLLVGTVAAGLARVPITVKVMPVALNVGAVDPTDDAGHRAETPSALTVSVGARSFAARGGRETLRLDHAVLLYYYDITG
jgi:hypothetical protein